ncbi:uncharacterized protein LOC110250832 [Exaiptasia diaphana]|uniref:LicD/FKTN/FKRP nucleotidyltransferase domain-containing protein n=1 Tax=Exaiptasia diaphana TaxID=2652724 RepID=A0A913Y2L8_EXADI|nr:uncharacterized protein LOC110250832 [Exaiptasia diaphana]
MSSTNSLDSYCGVTADNKDEMVKEIAKVKSEKMALLKSVVAMMKKRGIQFWLDSGTLLGAYRNGKMIPHDFDIDLSVFGEDDLNAAHEVLEAIKPDNYHVRKGHHNPDSVKVCKKVEIFKEVNGGYNCTHPSNVSMDIIMYDYADVNRSLIKTEYFGFNLEKNRYKPEWLFPLGKLKFEDMELPVPNDPEAWLTEQYGYLGPDCYYDETVHKYRKRPAAW